MSVLPKLFGRSNRDLAQIVLFIHLMTIRFYTADFLEANQTAQQLLIHHVMLFVTISIVLAASYLSVGKDDYRFRTVLYLIPMIMTAVNMGLYGALASVAAMPKTIVIAIIPMVIYAILAFQAVFKYSESYMVRFEELAEEFNEGQVTKRIEDPKVIHDSIFGPIALFVNQTLDTVQVNLEQIIDMNTLIASITEELSSSTEESSAQLSEVTQSMQQMEYGAVQQNEIVSNVKKVLSQNDESIATITDQIKGYADAVAQIALQTNILALNAGIEASRAGDYGRGFAVVAENVRRLSEETRTMSSNISEFTGEIVASLSQNAEISQAEFSQVVSIAEDTSQNTGTISHSITEVNSALQEIASLSQTLSESTLKLDSFLTNFTV